MSALVQDIDRLVAYALSRAGSPYIWAGKGATVWTPRGLRPHGLGRPVYDCSGLVTDAIHAAGGGDMRAAESAATLFATLEPTDDVSGFGVLRFYGAPNRVTHVAISLGRAHPKLGTMQVEAAGGDETTVTLEAAQRRGARVRVGYSTRPDFRGARLLRRM